MAATTPFDLFTNDLSPERRDQTSRERRDSGWPLPPPWRQFLSTTQRDRLISRKKDEERWAILDSLVPPDSRDARKGSVFRLPRDQRGQISADGQQIRNAVNAAIHLRRPLLVSGDPGSGKTSLAYAIAWELGLGPVLKWSITTRSRLIEDGLYSYDALGRLQDTQFDQMQEAEISGKTDHDGGRPVSRAARPIGDYITLGPVGTAFLPSRWPRVLLIDEIDKSDLQLPNELLQLFEEGEYLIKELFRDSARPPEAPPSKESALETSQSEASPAMDITHVRTIEKESPPVPIERGIVRCAEFPIVVMTSNRERDFPPAFHRRCLRVEMPKPTVDSLLPLVLAHFNDLPDAACGEDAANLKQWIAEFVNDDPRRDRATDQLLNAIFLRTGASGLSLPEEKMKDLEPILFKGLKEGG